MPTYSKGNKFITKFMVAGKRYSRMFDTKAEGEAWELQSRGALKLGKPVPVPENKRQDWKDRKTIDWLLRDTVALHWKVKGKGACKQVLNAEVFVRFCGPNMPVADAFSQDQVNKFFRHLVDDRRASNGTLNRYRSAVNVMAKRAKVTLPDWQRATEGKGRLRFFTDEDEAIITQTLKLWSLSRELDFFVFLIDTGLRPFSEAAQLEWSDVTEFKAGKETRRRATVYGIDGDGTKNNDSRAVPLTDRAWQAAQRQRSYSNKGPWRGLTKDHMRRIWDRLRAHLPQLADTVLYTCRHTCASRLVQRGVDIRRVQVWMGHKTIQITLRYAMLAPDHLFDAVSVLEAKPMLHLVPTPEETGDTTDRTG